MKPVNGVSLATLIGIGILWGGIGPVFGQAKVTILRTLGQPGDPEDSRCGLTLGPDGRLYGASSSGGGSDKGTVFRLNRDGSGLVVLKSFSGRNGDGENAYSKLVATSNGVLFGTTVKGGTNGFGTVFKLSTNGTDFQVMKSFDLFDGGGYNPYSGLLLASDGALYGITVFGGSGSQGTIFKMNQDGGGYVVLKNFGANGDAARPWAALIQATNGGLYGTTTYGGSGNVGAIFTIRPDGSGYSLLKSFGPPDGANPYGGLMQGQDGALYGMAQSGGTYGHGTIFRVNLDGTGFVTLRSFRGGPGSGSDDGGNPVDGALVQGSNGILYGTTTGGGDPNLGLGTVFQICADGSSYAVLKRFLGPAALGSPDGGLLRTSDGTLYGVGHAPYGPIFSVLPPAVILTPTRVQNDWKIRILGIPGRTYSLQGKHRLPVPGKQREQ